MKADLAVWKRDLENAKEQSYEFSGLEWKKEKLLLLPLDVPLRHLRIPKNLVGHMSVVVDLLLLYYCMSKSNQQKRSPSSLSRFFLVPFLLGKMTSCQSDWGKRLRALQ